MRNLKPIAILVLLAFGLKMMAGNVNLQQAEKVAMNFYFERHNMFQGEIFRDQISIQSGHIEKDAQQAYYYVFHFNPAGFVIVPADDCLVPVLGYSFEHSYVAENQPPNVQWWFQQYKDQVSFARENSLQPEMETSELWDHYLNKDFRYLPSKAASRAVAPLLTTLWNQNWPYNYYCPPTSTGGSGGHTWLGCAATAAAQILYYWRWPEQGQGYTSYISPVTPEYGIQSADFGNTWYRFNEMVDQPQTVNLAIAEFSYHIAVAMHMNFSPSGSGNTTYDSLPYFFKLMSPPFYYRDNMLVEQWKQLLIESIDDKYPVYYRGGNAQGGGHLFVCDGYQDEDYFHFNLGWGGTSNGYYTVDNIVGFNYEQFMITYICPDTVQFSYPNFCSGADTLVGLEGSISAGSGPIHNYLNDTYASWLIDPQTQYDSVTNIILTVKRLDLFEDGDRLFIYDGEDNTTPLLAELSGSNIPGNINSTGNKMFVEFITDDENTAAGFYLNYKTTQPVWCSGITTLTAPAAVFDDGSGSFYYYNNLICRWSINPGGICLLHCISIISILNLKMML